MTGFSKEVVETKAHNAFGALGVQVKRHGIDFVDVEIRPLPGVQFFTNWHRGVLNVVDPPSTPVYF